MNELILWNAQLSDLGNAIDMKNQQLKRMTNRCPNGTLDKLNGCKP
jgi:hypothetical protein